MPSNLLEEAIVDAEALREAALKSAQAAVLERYAPDVKKAIQVILEQEVLPTDEADDPLAGLESDTLPSPTGSSPPGEAPDPLANANAGAGGGGGLSTITEPENGPDPSAAVKGLPMAATESEKLCACPDEDEEIEINFDELEQQMAKTQQEQETQVDTGIPDGMGGGHDSNEDSEDINLKLSEEIEIDENLLSALFEENLEEERFNVVDGGGVYEENSEPLLNPDLKPMGAMEEGGKGSLSAQHRGLDYFHRTDDKYDGPPSGSKSRTWNKQQASKIQRRQGKQDVKTQQSELNESVGFSQNNTLIKENKQLTEVRRELLEENKKVKKMVQDLTRRLDEVNISNAKLVCTNKALTSNSLNERQKQKIVEAITKAKSVEEVNTIYETLQQTVGSGTGTKKQGPKSLNEAVENKGGLRFTSKEPEKKANPVYNRMQTLAGISKK